MRSANESSGADLHVRGHDLADGDLLAGGVEPAELPHDVPLGDDAEDALPVVAHDHRPDVVLRQRVQQLVHRGVGTDGEDGVGTLGRQDVAHAHVSLLGRVLAA